MQYNNPFTWQHLAQEINSLVYQQGINGNHIQITSVEPDASIKYFIINRQHCCIDYYISIPTKSLSGYIYRREFKSTTGEKLEKREDRKS